MTKTKTVEKFDKDGKLVERITETEIVSAEPFPFLQLYWPYIPIPAPAPAPVWMAALNICANEGAIGNTTFQ